MYRLLDVVFNPDLPVPDGGSLPNVAGEEAITLFDFVIYGSILLLCLGLLFFAVRKIRMIKNENI